MQRGMLRILFLTGFLTGLCIGFTGFGLPSQAADDWAALSSPALPAQVRFPAPPRADREQNGPKNLSGQVVDKNGNGLAQAVVHLKNKKTLEVITRISDGEGKYLFRGLNPEVDYSVHAEYQGASSDTQTVSMFDDRRDIYLVLQVDTSKQ